MSILTQGVNAIITERTTQVYGQLLEKAVQLSLEILILVFEKDVIVSDFWRPLYQVVDFMPPTAMMVRYCFNEKLPAVYSCTTNIFYWGVLKVSNFTFSFPQVKTLTICCVQL